MQDHLKPGYVISITARATNNLLKVTNTGVAECSGVRKQPVDSDCQFEVMSPSGSQPRAIRLRSVAYPQFFLAIVNGYFIGYVSDRKDYDLNATLYIASGTVKNVM